MTYREAMRIFYTSWLMEYGMEPIHSQVYSIHDWYRQFMQDGWGDSKYPAVEFLNYMEYTADGWRLTPKALDIIKGDT